MSLIEIWMQIFILAYRSDIIYLYRIKCERERVFQKNFDSLQVRNEFSLNFFVNNNQISLVL